MPARRYLAYISYHHGDRKVARWLHRAIETYRVPHKHLAATSLAPRSRLRPVFLDREELSSSSNLAESLRKALDESDFLIVVCSPAAAASRWVNEEIKLFKEQGKADKILCLVVAGEPQAVRRGLAPELESFPPALFGTAVDRTARRRNCRAAGGGHTGRRGFPPQRQAQDHRGPAGRELRCSAPPRSRPAAKTSGSVRPCGHGGMCRVRRPRAGRLGGTPGGGEAAPAGDPEVTDGGAHCRFPGLAVPGLQSQ